MAVNGLSWKVALVLFVFSLSVNAKTIYDLRTNYEVAPLSVEGTPVFSWKMDAAGQYKAAQTAYRIIVATSESDLQANRLVYDSQKQKSSQSVCCYYNGTPLKPCTRYFWQVQVWDEKGKMTESEPAWFETSLMNEGWSGAQWIGSPQEGLSKYASNLIFNFDVEVPEGSHAASFLFGAIDSQNYWGIQYNITELETISQDARKRTVVKRSQCPEIIFYHTSDGKKIEDARVDISSVIKEGAYHDIHHIELVNRPEEYVQYEITLKVDGQVIRASEKATAFVLKDDTKWRQMHRLHAIGIEHLKDQKSEISNIRISDYKHHTLFYSDDAKHVVDGSGEVQIWTPNGDVAAPMLRKSFSINKNVKKATLYATSRGIYELSLNGDNLSDDFFNPGWTDYNFRLMYNTYDLTDVLRKGNNVVGAVLGTGWWKGVRYLNPKWYDCYGASLSLLAKLVIEYEDGSKETHVTDDSWLCSNDGPIMTNDLFDGVDYDARREIYNWNTADFDASAWKRCKVYEALDPNVKITPYIGQPVRPDTILVAQGMTQPLPHTYIYDMGQNLVGVPRIYIKGRNGQTITLKYAEMLYPDVIPVDPVPPYTIEEYKAKKGQMYTENYRSAMSTDHYTLKGTAEGEIFEPHFTCHGFRYIEITGIDEALPLKNVQVIVLNSLQDRNNCDYKTSDKLINQLFSNIQWGERGNFVSIPTDCPQRDERAGWSGDAQIFCRTATYNRNVNPFYHRWMLTVRDDQSAEGGFKDVNPTCKVFGTAFGWADVGVILPWQVYLQYGDKTMLEENYEAMKRYVQYNEKRAVNYIQRFGGYGDWVAVAPTQSDLTNTCYSGWDVQIMQKVAKILGKTADEQYYANLFANIKKAFNERFVDKEGYMISPVGSPVSLTPYGGASAEKLTEPRRITTQTAYVVPLMMNMIDESVASKTCAHLAELVRRNGYKLNTGFIGTPYLNMVLSEYGHDDVAYRLIEQQEYPSWLYPVLQGATTMWERWNSYTIKNGFGPVSMNSFNHYAYGAVQDWLIAYSAGIQRDEAMPGYKHIHLQPRIGGHLTFVEARFNSVYGEIFSSWKSDNADVTNDAANYAYTYSATVPANTTATLTLPVGLKKVRVLEGKKGILKKVETNGSCTIELSSGSYKFYISK